MLSVWNAGKTCLYTDSFKVKEVWLLSTSGISFNVKKCVHLRALQFLKHLQCTEATFLLSDVCP